MKTKYLVIGIGNTGKSLLKYLSSIECIAHFYDDNEDNTYINEYKYDYVILSPSISREHKVAKEQESKGAIVLSEIEFSYPLVKGKFIGITGTNGKTTITTLINQIINKAGKQCYLAGNIGIPLIELANKTSEDDYIALELSSFQLISARNAFLDYGIISNIDKDHLDVHNSLEEYQNAKTNLLSLAKDINNVYICVDDEFLSKLNTKANTYTITSKDAFINIVDNIIKINNRSIFETSDIPNMTGFNLDNCLPVIAICKKIGISNKIIVEVIKNYQKEKYRLKKVGVNNGKCYYNDSKATNIHATICAVNSLTGNIALILGGKDKGVSYDELMLKLSEKVKYILICGENYNNIISSCKKYNYFNYYVFNELESVVSFANSLDGIDIVLFSPSAASFDKYSGYEERGEHYDQIIKSLIEKESRT